MLLFLESNEVMSENPLFILFGSCKNGNKTDEFIIEKAINALNKNTSPENYLITRWVKSLIGSCSSAGHNQDDEKLEPSWEVNC